MTDKIDERQGGAWIGHQPDENTERVRDNLPEGTDRVAVTNNEADAGPDSAGWPRGHRQGDQASDDDVRRAGEDG